MRIDDDTRRRLSRARDFLEHDDGTGGGPVSVSIVAKRSGISSFHFIRTFERVFGVTPHQYRVASRLTRARQLLATGQPVTEVCFQVGFQSLGSFSTLFTKRMGEAPSLYQRRMRRIVQVPADLVRVMHPGCFSLMGLLPADAFRNFREARVG